jgi:hypothetical protein
MQFKIIVFLIAFIFTILGLFGLKEIKELKASKKALELQIKANNEQMQLFKLDSEQRNQEIINNQGKINDLQKKLKTQFNSTSCVNTIIDNTFIEFLRNNSK